MNGDYLDHEEVRLLDIVKHAIHITDGNIIFIAFYFAVNFFLSFGFEQFSRQFVTGDTVADAKRLVPFFLVFVGISTPVGAFVDSVIGALLRRQVLVSQPDSSASFLRWVSRFFIRMLLLNAIQGIALITIMPIDAAIYVFLRYVSAFVIWQDCRLRIAFPGAASFVSARFDKFFPVWLVGTVLLVCARLGGMVPASKNPAFMGLIHLVLAYSDFAIVAIALVSFIMLQGKRQEAVA